VAALKMHSNLVVFREPVLAPVVHHQIAVEPDFDSSVGVGLKLVVAGRGS
jgi:hypothetical protein